jgi:acetyl-CoA acetyltransferase family protein
VAESAFIYDAVRTPFGKIGGALSGVRPDDLAAEVLSGLLKRSPGVEPAAIEEVAFGNANGAGEENRNVARMAVLLAGLPTSVPGVTMNRLCGSGLEAVISNSRAIETGDLELAVSAGVESMSRAPWVALKPDTGFERRNLEMHSTTLGWRMINPKMNPAWTVSLGVATENVVARYQISREAQDNFAAESHQKAAAAWAAGKFKNQILSVSGVDIDIDETIRESTTAELLTKLKPIFQSDGTITAGNASPMNDGAAALFIGSKSAGRHFATEPLARVVSRGVAAVDPDYFGIGPVEAANIALKRAGLSWNEIDFVELNEAFAGQSLACLKLWPELDPTKVNINGGAIAIGHPLGASGVRIIGSLAHTISAEAKRSGRRVYGLAAICIGVGQGLAMVIEA